MTLPRTIAVGCSWFAVALNATVLLGDLWLRAYHPAAVVSLLLTVAAACVTGMAAIHRVLDTKLATAEADLRVAQLALTHVEQAAKRGNVSVTLDQFGARVN